MAAQAGACLGTLLSCVRLSHRQRRRKHPACATGAHPGTDRLAGHWGTGKELQPERRALSGGSSPSGAHRACSVLKLRRAEGKVPGYCLLPLGRAFFGGFAANQGWL